MLQCHNVGMCACVYIWLDCCVSLYCKIGLSSVSFLLSWVGQDGEPVKVGVAMTDMSTGLYAYGAILAALMVQQRTGKGQKIDCNLLSTQVPTHVRTYVCTYIGEGGWWVEVWLYIVSIPV